MNRPRLLDLFCGAGGAGEGYHRAGFEVVGVDINPQPRYPFEFHRADAIEFLLAHGRSFDAIHASPPCQAYTLAQRIRSRKHPELIDTTRAALNEIGLPWVIENVPGSPLINPIELCGAMFPNLQVYRHRLFESSIPLVIPDHPVHQHPIAKMGRPAGDGQFMHVVGNYSGVSRARTAMGITWMIRNELSEAIPPAYTEFVGRQLMEHLRLTWPKLSATLLQT